MLKKPKNRLKINRQNKSEFKRMVEETVRDGKTRAGLKTAKESGYAAKNTTEKMDEIAGSLGKGIDFGTQY